MDERKRQRLEQAGWRVGTVAEFLGLSDEESAYVEMKLALSRSLRQLRDSRGVTQMELAGRLGSSQSRVAKMEASDRSVSVDLLMRGLLALGATQSDIASVIAGAGLERRETHVHPAPVGGIRRA